MTAPYPSTSARSSDALGVPPSSPNRCDSDVDEILSLFKSVFGVGISLARYIVDDPLWSILAAAGLPCPTCVRVSALSIFFPQVLSRLGFRSSFPGGPRRPGSVHPTEQWRVLYDHVEQSTNSTSALLKLNPLDDQDQWELDREELREFHQHQLLVPGPSTSVPHTSPLAGGSSLPPPAPVTKKHK
ncbi:hypothetical protein C8R41DRAFT_872278 [Lentinula lateritia]|uniref:Uncharacterized protein n=1 Tax=Lentinula lateritia TaxID=40482 RepID=A0ABQ8V2Y4_9AGAR|nr:hypothetical protein C8R41DRAFT_872278 [Lentinula lateritia]